jgi:hypothetical protein
VVLLIVLGSFVAAAGNVTLWLRNTIINTNAWVSTVAPLSQNEVIVNTLSAYVVGEVFDAINVQQVAQEILPPEAVFLSGPLTNALEGVVRDAASNVIRSEQFNAIWVTVNKAVHPIIIGALRGGDGLLYLKEGRLTIDLSDLFAFVESALGFEALDAFADRGWSEFVLLESRQVAAVQQVVSTLDTVGLLLPLLALLIFVVAWLVSLWRRRTLLWIGVAVAITMALSLLLFAVARPVFLAAIIDPLVRAVSGELWNIVVRRLLYQTILLLVVGALIAVGAWLAGPHERAVAIRTSVREQVKRLTE